MLYFVSGEKEKIFAAKTRRRGASNYGNFFLKNHNCAQNFPRVCAVKKEKGAVPIFRLLRASAPSRQIVLLPLSHFHTRQFDCTLLVLHFSDN